MQGKINCLMNPKTKICVKDLFDNKIYEYKWPSFTYHVVQTKDGLWICMDDEDYTLLEISNIDPSELTKEELDLCLSLLKA